MTSASITAIVYSPGSNIDRTVSAVAEHLHGQGWHLAGLVQLNEPRSGDARCDMTLRDLTSAERLAISEQRGRHARGCMLDVAELVRGVMLASKALEQKPDLLIVNKFGKTEACGGGFRGILADAIARGVPVLIAVPAVNLDAWKSFTAGLTTTHWIDDLPTDTAQLCNRLGLYDRRAVPRPGSGQMGGNAGAIEGAAA
jgi:nucleoside-triphosphatase THEP1